MKKQLCQLLLCLSLFPVATAEAESFEIDGKTYRYDVLSRMEIGPGVTYTRLRIPDYPLNINYMEVDLTNPYNAIETQQANETLGSTEKLADAYDRWTAAGRKPLGGQNANFWVVSTQPLYEDFCMGATYNGNLKDGQIITETNGYNDQWDGGPTRTGVVGIDCDKQLWIESMSWKGTVSSEHWGAESTEIVQVNKFCRASGELTLYNSFYGRDKAFKTIEQVDGKWTLVDGLSCEVYVDIDDGYSWTVGEDFVGTVKDVRTNTSAGKLEDYDLCLTGTDSYKAMLEKLQPGDKVTLNNFWTSLSSGETTRFEILVVGYAMVMVDGELTGRNEDETYNSQIYSRSAYGMSQDRNTLYMLVIDKATDPIYGSSVGCNTSVMCQVMKQLGAWNVCNVDAGGSAQLMVRGSVVNKTTEATPRAVANRWMVCSTAPDDAESKTITRLEFLDPQIEIPIYSTYTPTILGYNKYGELIDDDVEEVELTCDAELGTTSGNNFYAGGQNAVGMLNAQKDGIIVSRSVQIVDAEIAVKHPNIIIDDRSYPIEIVSNTDYASFPCDASRLDWTVGDESVAVIENGVLRGLQTGQTTIEGSVSGFSTRADVSVEIPSAKMLSISDELFNGVELTQSGGTGLKATETNEGGYSLTYTGNGSGRGAYIQLNKGVRLFSLPTALRLSINPGEATISKITASLTDGYATTYSSAELSAATLPKNQVSEVEVRFEDLFDVNDIGYYPLTLNALRLGMGASEKDADFSIEIGNVEALYGDDAGVVALPSRETEKIRIYPNPSVGGVAYVCADWVGEKSVVSVFDSVGTMLWSGPAVFDGGCFWLNLGSLLSGIYYVKVDSGDQSAVEKLIVK